jgi:branched-chain amino acid transport system substrate-binding protein
LKRRPTALATAAALAALTSPVAGCGGDDAERAGTQPILGRRLAVYVSVPSRGDDAGAAKALQRGAELALAERRGRAGRYGVRLRALDARAGGESAVRRNGRLTVQDTTSVGYIGEIESQVTKVTMPQLNHAGVAQIAPTATYTGLTRGGEASEPGEPDKYNPTGVRTLARLVPPDTVQGAALVEAARQAGCARVRIWRSNTPFGLGIARSVKSAAGDRGLDLAGTEEIKPQQPSYARQAEDVAADCLVWAGEPETSGVQILNDAASGNRTLKLFAPNSHCTSAAVDARGGISAATAPRLRCTRPVVEPRSGRGAEVLARYRERFGDRGVDDAYAVYGYEAMMVLLDAVAKAAGAGDAITRAAVSEAVYSLGPRDGAIGRYEIDSGGDVDVRTFGLFEIAGGELRQEKLLQPKG